MISKVIIFIISLLPLFFLIYKYGIPVFYSEKRLRQSWSKNIKHAQHIRNDWEPSTLFLRIQSGLMLLGTLIIGSIFYFFIGLVIFS